MGLVSLCIELEGRQVLVKGSEDLGMLNDRWWVYFYGVLREVWLLYDEFFFIFYFLVSLFVYSYLEREREVATIAVAWVSAVVVIYVCCRTPFISICLYECWYCNQRTTIFFFHWCVLKKRKCGFVYIFSFPMSHRIRFYKHEIYSLPFPSLWSYIYKTYNITQHENLNMDIAWLLCVRGPKTLNSSSLVISMIMRYMLSHYVHLTLFKG